MGVNKHTHTGAHICTLVCAHTNTYNMSTPSFCSGQWLMQGPITAESIENKWSGAPIPMRDTCISFAKAWEPYRSVPEGWIDVLWTLSPGYDIATELIKLLYAITCISLHFLINIGETWEGPTLLEYPLAINGYMKKGGAFC